MEIVCINILIYQADKDGGSNGQFTCENVYKGK